MLHTPMWSQKFEPHSASVLQLWRSLVVHPFADRQTISFGHTLGPVPMQCWIPLLSQTKLPKTHLSPLGSQLPPALQASTHLSAWLSHWRLLPHAERPDLQQACPRAPQGTQRPPFNSDPTSQHLPEAQPRPPHSLLISSRSWQPVAVQV